MVDTSREFQVWYDAYDGARRSLNATDHAGVAQIIAELDADHTRRDRLAESIGMKPEPHDYNLAITEVTTTIKQVRR